MAATIRDIARQASVSPSAVSAVLNRRGAASTVRISEDTRQRILRTARELDYQRNVMARSLREGRTFTMAFFSHGLHVENNVQKIDAILRQACARGYRVLLRCQDHILDQTDIIARDVGDMLSRQVDGFIINPAEHTDGCELERLIRQEVPLVTIHTPTRLDVDWIGVDGLTGGRLAVEHMLGLGRRRLAFIAASHNPWSPAISTTIQPRVEGWRQACAAGGVDFQALPYVEIGDNPDSAMAGYQACRSLLDSRAPVDALVASNDLVALGVMRALFEAGVRVPADVAIIGYDNNHFSASLPVPLTTIAQPVQALAVKAVDRLIQRIEARQAGQALATERVVLPPQLIVRQSTMVPRNSPGAT